MKTIRDRLVEAFEQHYTCMISSFNLGFKPEQAADLVLETIAGFGDEGIAWSAARTGVDLVVDACDQRTDEEPNINWFDIQSDVENIIRRAIGLALAKREAEPDGTQNNEP